MVIVPSSNIVLLKTPLELSDNNQLTWSTSTEQYNYFNSLTKLTLDDATYVRKEGVIRYPTNQTTTYEDLLQYNYCMYQNEAYDNKWFYAYITDITYINDGLATIKIETDVWNTWWNDITLKQSFVEREHVSDDTIGLHTIPEGLETGEYICSNKTALYSGGNTCYVAVATSYVPDELALNTLTTRYGGIYSGTPILIFDSPYNSVSNFLRGMDALDKGDAIVGVYMIPSELAGSVTFETKSFTAGGHTYTTHVAIPQYTDSETLLTTSGTLTPPSTINGYTPKNNKLKCYPYSYFYVSNNAGVDVEYHYEDFTNNSAQFKTIGVLTAGCSIKCIPLNYKKLSDTGSSYNSFNAGITGAKYPICSWKSDIYTNWLTENGVNLTISGLSSVASLVGGTALLLSGAGALVGGGMIAGGLTGITSSLTKVYEHSLIPPQAKGNTNSGDVAFSSGSFDIPAYSMTIKQEYAKIIDDYFTMYGYKVNTLKVPSIRGRLNWNYVKTIGCNLIGDIPQLDLEKIKKLFDNGVTFWHHTNTFLDYSQSNTIVS